MVCLVAQLPTQCCVFTKSSLGPTWIVFILSAIFTFIQRDELNHVIMADPERTVCFIICLDRFGQYFKGALCSLEKKLKLKLFIFTI